ncbi:MFS transporter [Streptomyces caniferus]|uniref:MFS transporter n=1 Tax=Streptomyces caniferus TaxID=285557 RepID=A0A640S6C3_9ACTN|nr:MFS transporter [Streptomyces caniferus]GFE06162.1 MFS transporter [Streptomyces caniferus]
MGGLGLTFDGLDVASLAFLLPSASAEWHLSSAQTGLLGSSTLMGYLVGALLAGIVGDRVGRRRVMMWALTLYCTATLLAAFAPNWEFFFAARVLAGVGTGSESVIIPSFLSEFAPGRLRGRFVGGLAGFFSFGYVMAALLGRFVVPASADGWRIVQVICTLPVLMLLWWRRSVPESPRFLVAVGREDEARRVVDELEAQAVSALGRELPPVPPSAPAPVPPRTPPPTVLQGLAALWRGGLARRTAPLWLLWLVNTFAFYGFFTFVPTLLAEGGLTITKSFSYSIVIYLAQIPGYYVAALLNDVMDRKWTIGVCLGGGAVSAALLSSSGISAQVMVYGAMLSFFMNGVYASIYAYTPEVYPTVIRAQGVGAASAFGRVGGIAAPLIIGSAYPTLGFTGVFVMTAAALLVGALAILAFGVSTKGRTLEDIALPSAAPPGPAPDTAAHFTPADAPRSP